MKKMLLTSCWKIINKLMSMIMYVYRGTARTYHSEMGFIVYSTLTYTNVNLNSAKLQTYVLGNLLA